MLARAESYDAARAAFRWRVPDRFNIGVDVTRHPQDRLALIHVGADGSVEEHTVGAVAKASNRLANVLTAHGLGRGDRVGVLLPQRPETAVAHVAAYKAGLVAVPLFALFGPDALEYRLRDSGARAVVTDTAGRAKLEEIRDALPDLSLILDVDRPADYADLLARASDAFAAVDTAADDPALIIYTSGTTGPPKGALHGHRVLLGHLPGVEWPHEFFPQPGDRFWTPADWAWIGGLLDVLLPAWHHGVPVVSHRMAKFDPEAAFALIRQHGIRNMFLPPTALKLMRQAPAPAMAVRSIGSGGETLGAELLEWGRATFGVTINEFYGQTECNLVVGNNAAIMDVRPGSMGRAIPGHTVAVVGDAGGVVPTGETGVIAIRRPDAVMFLGYWNDPAATAAKFAGDWLKTGDTGRMDADGYLWFVGRDDDVITSAGYRIGPGEIEDSLMRHPAVALAAAVGVPDPVRTERVKAFVVLAEGHAGSEALAEEIQAFVKTRLAAHEYPREVAFVDALPMTTTGKVMRRVLRERG